MRMSSKKPIVTVKEKEDGGWDSVMDKAQRSQTRLKKFRVFQPKISWKGFSNFFFFWFAKNKKYEHMNWGRTLLSLYFFLTDADLILNSDVLEIVKNWKLNKHVEIESYVVIALMQEDRSYRELPPGCSTWSCRWGSHRGKGERRHT